MKNRTILLLAAVIAVAVTFGVIALQSPGAFTINSPEEGSSPTNTTTQTPTNNGGIGIENGYIPNEALSINTSDGFSKSEIKKLKWRSMARVEKIRQLEFKKNVPVSVKKRSDLSFPEPGERVRNQRNLIYEALFTVGEDRDAMKVKREMQQGSVLGYYSAGSNELVIITGENSSQFDESVLAHELTHALQDQYKISDSTAKSFDGHSANLALTEGEAELVDMKYQEKCNTDWQCVSSSDSSASPPQNLKLYKISIFPYLEGPKFVRHYKQKGGWDKITQIGQNNQPSSSEQIIHPKKYPSDQPVDITPPQFDATQSVRAGTISTRIGEQSMAAMISDSEGVQVSDYKLKATSGWEGDRLYEFKVNDKQGYIWKTRWETKKDATQFRKAYVNLLKAYGAKQTSEGVWTISSGSFADSFIVVQNKTSVKIYNAESASGVKKAERVISGSQ